MEICLDRSRIVITRIGWYRLERPLDLKRGLEHCRRHTWYTFFTKRDALERGITLSCNMLQNPHWLQRQFEGPLLLPLFALEAPCRLRECFRSSVWRRCFLCTFKFMRLDLSELAPHKLAAVRTHIR